jgi:hypothetical protein
MRVCCKAFSMAVSLLVASHLKQRSSTLAALVTVVPAISTSAGPVIARLLWVPYLGAPSAGLGQVPKMDRKFAAEYRPKQADSEGALATAMCVA